MSTDLSVIEGNFVELRREPSEVLDDARRAAKALTTVIDQKPHKVMIKGKVYLEYEDWQTVAQFYGYTVRTGSSEPTEINGVKGAKANAELIDFRTGIVVGGAEAYCMSDEENWGNKPWFQLASMAQTRAGSKAIRNRMAWVVVLAGYAGTPAEEVTEDMRTVVVVNKTEHYCKLHDTPYFMKGKMKSYAHPIEGTDPLEWCHEHKAKPKDEIGAQAQPTSQPVTPPSSGVEEQPSPIDLTWLREALDKIEKSGVDKWRKADVLARLNITVNGEHKKISDAVRQLSSDQAADFASEVADMLKMM